MQKKRRKEEEGKRRIFEKRSWGDLYARGNQTNKLRPVFLKKRGNMGSRGEGGCMILVKQTNE